MHLDGMSYMETHWCPLIFLYLTINFLINTGERRYSLVFYQLQTYKWQMFLTVVLRYLRKKNTKIKYIRIIQEIVKKNTN